MKKLGVLFLMMAFLVSCDSIGVFEQNHFFPEHQWSSKQQPAFTITYLDCDTNQLISLPILPDSLHTLDCGNNQLNGLPFNQAV